MLISYGGDVNQANRDRKTAQDVASGECTEFLLKIGKCRIGRGHNVQNETAPVYFDVCKVISSSVITR